MNIHPLWALCITVRTLIVIISIYIAKSKSKTFKIIATIILFLIGFGFLFKALTGSNNEKQIAKVFWHNTRLVHSSFYLLAAYYMYNGNHIICGILLTLDIIFSILYRLTTNQ